MRYTLMAFDNRRSACLQKSSADCAPWSDCTRRTATRAASTRHSSRSSHMAVAVVDGQRTQTPPRESEAMASHGTDAARDLGEAMAMSTNERAGEGKRELQSHGDKSMAATRGSGKVPLTSTWSTDARTSHTNSSVTSR